jgi:hypothetical protein
MYGVAAERRPIFVESDAFLYNLGGPIQREMYEMEGDMYPTTRAVPYGRKVVCVFYVKYMYGI